MAEESIELRCCFKHRHFFSRNVYQGDGTSQCWLRGNDDVAMFKENGEEKPYCLFHAPAELEPIKPKEGWKIAQRGKTQATRLRHHLDAWNEENESRDNDKKLAFILPYMQCGNIYLIGYNFSSDVRFEHATFSGDTWFYNATFSGYALFYNATFSGYARFDNATFSGYARFDNATFSGNAGFNDATFSGNAGFYNATFSYLDIINCNFTLPTSFAECKIHRLKYNTHIGERLSFIKCKPLDYCLLKNKEQIIKNNEDIKTNEGFVTDAHWGFTNNDCSKLSFTSCDISYADFRGSYIDDTHLIACDYQRMKDSKYHIIYNEKENKIETEEADRRLYYTYQNLKRNLEKVGDYKKSGSFHFREMEIRCNTLKDKRKTTIPEWVDLTTLQLYSFVADFGESYKKLGISLIASFFIMAALINISQIIGGGFEFNYLNGSYTDNSYFKYLEVLISNMTPLNVSKEIIDTSPTKDSNIANDLNVFSEIIVVLEWIIAVTLATLFVMAVRRNFRR